MTNKPRFWRNLRRAAFLALILVGAYFAAHAQTIPNCDEVNGSPPCHWQEDFWPNRSVLSGGRSLVAPVVSDSALPYGASTPIEVTPPYPSPIAPFCDDKFSNMPCRMRETPSTAEVHTPPDCVEGDNPSPCHMKATPHDDQFKRDVNEAVVKGLSAMQPMTAIPSSLDDAQFYDGLHPVQPPKIETGTVTYPDCVEGNNTRACTMAPPPACPALQPVGPSIVFEDMQAHAHKHLDCIRAAKAQYKTQFDLHRALEACETKQ